MAKTAATNTGHPGIEARGNSIRVFFMFKRVRHSHTLRLEPTRNNIKHAVSLRSAALFALRSGSYNEAEFFPHSRSAASTAPGKRVGDLCERYKPLKAVDITPETQSRYEVALDICVDTLGRNRMLDSLLPEDIQKLRADLIATRAVSTVNHYLATFSGFLHWCESNKYCGELANHCVHFTKSNKDPDPLNYEEYLSLIEKGCVHPIDRAAITVAVYTGLRPGELLALAEEDVASDFSRITVRRSITQSVTFKVPKTKKERTVLLQPPARDAMKVLVENAAQREPADLTVWLNRHESRVDRVRVLLAPIAQTRKKPPHAYIIPGAWNRRWTDIVRRAEIRPRPPYQTRHTFACWNLTARGNLAFIANQMGHRDYSMLVTVYGRWIDTESSKELERIWEGMQNMAQVTPKLPLTWLSNPISL
ncbi:tyrosine-type recombinase/integrase [Variovorax sp.]|jgi:integrase|uniref:tyrosine-type recombinase/integrase n=1 Tax=Variovorax sp. TaxID=1871043 RepID=UPI0037DA4437